jgi:hypothetical protein
MASRVCSGGGADIVAAIDSTGAVMRATFPDRDVNGPEPADDEYTAICVYDAASASIDFPEHVAFFAMWASDEYGGGLLAMFGGSN